MIILQFDEFSGKITNDENGDIADDHYHLYLVNISFIFYLFLVSLNCLIIVLLTWQEDMKLMSSLGINVY